MYSTYLGVDAPRRGERPRERRRGRAYVDRLQNYPPTDHAGFAGPVVRQRGTLRRHPSRHQYAPSCGPDPLAPGSLPTFWADTTWQMHAIASGRPPPPAGMTSRLLTLGWCLGSDDRRSVEHDTAGFDGFAASSSSAPPERRREGRARPRRAHVVGGSRVPGHRNWGRRWPSG